ncbi:hypothetical protein N7468_001250 [Penicillium chermesinum]|uniref:Uncharacterized protein n=1 Tax=Penicillium chermesinum TaxID=63820 RepID=A0A9W9PJ77_9EURO|nr:uncharacterized protein N7468_001250 [Penicillium chermesinum]KAJ5246267.1 hypothetical protein N7468_001250 [Penicillium chermesinum]KAJ6144555.1 hypothetical protein N7470_008450 [Penicillium chermesinum]
MCSTLPIIKLGHLMNVPHVPYRLEMNYKALFCTYPRNDVTGDRSSFRLFLKKLLWPSAFPVLVCTLFPTLAGWKSKGIAALFPGIVAAPLFLLTSTIPIIEQAEDENHLPHRKSHELNRPSRPRWDSELPAPPPHLDPGTKATSAYNSRELPPRPLPSSWCPLSSSAS